MSEADEATKKRAMNVAFGEGVKYGILGLLVGGTATLVGMRRSVAFNRYMSNSAKTSIPVMLGLFAFAVEYELTLVDIQRRPEIYGLSDEVIKSGIVSRMPVHHRAMNYIHDNPFAMVLGLSVPFAATVFYKQMHLKHLSLSQKVMHSRVFAQGGIIIIALSTMAFKEYMDRRGRFPEPGDQFDDQFEET